VPRNDQLEAPQYSSPVTISISACLDDIIRAAHDNSFRPNIKCQLIYAVMYQKTSLSSAARSLNIDKTIANKTLSIFKILLKRALKMPARKRGRRPKIEPKHVEWARDFVKDNYGRHFTLNTLAKEMNSAFKNEISVSKTTIQRMLKTKLGMSYKKLTKSNPKAIQLSHKRSFLESLTVQLELLDRGFELIYIDEFSWSPRATSVYGWAPIGTKRNIILNQSSFSMTFI
jgi:transposase